jgi:hypothetical protein
MFAAVHTINAGGKWLKVSCHNPLGMNAGGCALCSAHQANPKGSISKATKKLFIPMLVSYRDPSSATGYSPAAPVIWDRPAGFSREIANKLMVAGDLRNVLVLITRNGKAGDMQTTYSVDVLPATHPVFKPEMIPADFSAFKNFNIAKHSFWEKSVEDINTFLTTGSLPEYVKPQAQTQTTVQEGAYVAPTAFNAPTAAPTFNTQPAPATPAYQAPVTPAAPTYTPPVAPAVTEAPAAQPAVTTDRPQRNFGGFSF